MSDENIILSACFVVTAVINFFVYLKLSKYLYIAAGVKAEDVRKYKRNHIGRRSQRRLARWLAQRSGGSREFKIMFALINTVAFLFVVLPPTGFVVLLGGGTTAARVIAAAGLFLTVIVPSAAVMYGKKLEVQRETYFASSQYQPYVPEEEPGQIESIDELYKTADKAFGETNAGLDDIEKAERKKFIKTYSIKVFFVITVIFCFFSVFISNGIPLSSVKDTVSRFIKGGENAALSDTNTTDEVTTDEVTIITVREKLIENGFTVQGFCDAAAAQFPDCVFEDCLMTDEGGMHMEYFDTVNADSAEKLWDRIKQEAAGRFGTDNAEITNDAGRGFSTYAVETGEYYAAVVLNGKGVLYVYTEPINAAWVKTFLYELGFLKTF